MELTHVGIGKKQKAIIVLFTLAFAVVFALVIKRVYIDRDYLLVSEVDCDPAVEVCFQRLCEDCDSSDAEYEFYKKQLISASHVPLCDSSQGDCPELVCAETVSCLQESCSEANVPENEECSNPENFIQEESLPGEDAPDVEDVIELQDSEEI